MDLLPLRIALISAHASPLAALGGDDAGGQNVYVENIARQLARLGHQVDVLTRRDSPGLPPIVELEPRLRVVHVPAGPTAPIPKEELLPHMAAFTAATVQHFRHGEPYDAVHANFFLSGLAGLRLKTLLDVPLVMTFHGLGLVQREHPGLAEAFPPERIAIERRIVWAADRIVAECPQDESDLLRLYSARPDRVVVVPCGVDAEEFCPASKARARRRLGLPKDEFVILHLGRLVPHKGVDNLVRAVARLDRTRPVRLLVVGGNSAQPDPALTPEIARLTTLARECGVADAVAIVGQRQGAARRDCYAAADVFASTPWYEPFGITLLEAMACGVPVIGSAVGGLRCSVAEGSTGFLVQPGDAAALAERLQQLRDDPALAKKLGRAGMHRVRTSFTWDRVATQLVDAYETVRRRADVTRQAPRLSPVLSAAVPL